ncbi:MAG: hypothetical protein AB7J34_08995 [Limisphaerales bacterium]
MENDDKMGSIESILGELKKTTPAIRLGFPQPEELQRMRRQRHETQIQRLERLERERGVRFERLKQMALANIRRDRP